MFSTPIRTSLVVALAACASVPALAFPIAAPGTEGLSVFTTGGEVIATYEGNSASYSNDLYLGQTLIFNNHTTPVGTMVSLGTFAAGTELIFTLFVNNTGYTYSTGAASRNPDGHEHARVQSNWEPGKSLVSFEDLYNGPFVYNDLSFSFTNTVGAVPEPATVALLLAGLGVVASMARRRRVS